MCIMFKFEFSERLGEFEKEMIKKNDEIVENVKKEKLRIDELNSKIENAILDVVKNFISSSQKPLDAMFNLKNNNNLDSSVNELMLKRRQFLSKLNKKPTDETARPLTISDAKISKLDHYITPNTFSLKFNWIQTLKRDELNLFKTSKYRFFKIFKSDHKNFDVKVVYDIEKTILVTFIYNKYS